MFLHVSIRKVFSDDGQVVIKQRNKYTFMMDPEKFLMNWDFLSVTEKVSYYLQKPYS